MWTWLPRLGSFAGYAVRRVRERPSTLLLVPAMLAWRLTATRRSARQSAPPSSGVRPSIPWSAGAHGLAPGRVSIVLPIVNPESMAESLARLAEQTHPDTEIVVVSYGCDQAPHGAVASSGSHRVRMLGVSGASLSEALTAGFSVATGELWTWMTHPVVSDTDCLEMLAGALAAQPDADLVYVRDSGTLATSALELGAGTVVSRCFLVRGSLGLALGKAAAVLPADDPDGVLMAAAGLRVHCLGDGPPVARRQTPEAPLRLLADSVSPSDINRVFPLAHLLPSGASEPFDALAASSHTAPSVARDAAALIVVVHPDDPWPGWVGAACRAVSQERTAVVVEHGLAGEVAALFAPALVVETGARQTARVLDLFVRQCARRPRGAQAAAADGPQWTALDALDRPLKLLLQVADFTRGGLEKVVLELGSALRARNIEIALLVTGRAGADVKLAQSYGWQVIVDSRAWKKGRYGDLLEVLSPDVVHAHDAWFGAEACATRQIPFVQTLHNCHVWLTDRARAQVRFVDQATTAYACVSEQVARYAGLALHLDVGKMVLVPNGVSPALGQGDRAPGTRLAAREGLGLPRDALLYLCVASILPAKAQRALVRAFAAVHAKEPSARLLLVGGVINQAYWADVRRTIESTRVTDAVTYVPFTDSVNRYYAAADVFVLPSMWEGWSLALAEAVLMGLPVVATRVGSAAAFETYGSVHLIEPPFEAIEELNPDMIRSLSWHDDAAFVERLADAMREAAVSPSSSGLLPRAVAERLSSARVHDTYTLMYRWLAQGGSVHGLRRLSRDGATLA